jgi:hypothetical protein
MKRIIFSSLLGLSATLLGNSAVFADEVHLIGTYSGKRVDSSEYYRLSTLLISEQSMEPHEQQKKLRELEARFPSRVDVHVTRTGAPLTLVLTAYETTKWRIKLADGVTIKKIILSGYHDQSLRKNAKLKGVKVEKLSYIAGDDDYFYFYQDDREIPVGFFDPGNLPTEQPRCVLDDLATRVYHSEFERTLKMLKKKGLIPTTVQANASETDGSRFSLSNITPASSVPKVRSASLCYRNPDGSVSPGDR